MADETKRCSKCGIVKSLSGFSSWVRDGRRYHRSHCKECLAKASREWRQRALSAPPVMLPLDEFQQKRCSACRQVLPLSEFGPSRTARLGVRCECRKCGSEKATRWRVDNAESAFNAYLRRTYGITLERYSELLAEQGGFCAICGEPPTVENSGRWTKKRRHPAPPKLVVDHDHETGKVRGLLCGRCNAGIGQLRDSAEIVRFALKYLEERS